MTRLDPQDANTSSILTMWRDRRGGLRIADLAAQGLSIRNPQFAIRNPQTNVVRSSSSGLTQMYSE
jgi:hypothetical protein